jgi:uncharacterized protein YbjT (DUF2867 family)
VTAARTALIAGATGLVGGECLRRLLAHPAWSSVVVLTRRAVAAAGPATPKLRQVVTEFVALDDRREELVAEHIFCALGTTMRKAGSRDAFRTVDLEYPLELARLTRANGARHFSLVSAVGADRHSAFYYSRVKGELEYELRRMDWPSLAIFRPSLIAGDRIESRPLERVASHLLGLAPAAWRPVAAVDIAAAMIAVALDSPTGVTVVESRQIAELARHAGEDTR